MDTFLAPEIEVNSPESSGFASNGEPQITNGSVSNMGQEGKLNPWKRTFDMRHVNLSNFPLNSSAHRLPYRSQNSLLSRAKSNVVSSPVQSLKSLQKVLQKNINEEIDEIIQSYIEKFFRPAIENIRKNNNDSNCISDHHVQAVCRNILDEAKKLYYTGVSNNQRCHSPLNTLKNNDHLNISENENSSSSLQFHHLTRKRNKADYSENDSESEAESHATGILEGEISDKQGNSIPIGIKKKVGRKKKLKTSPTAISSRTHGKGHPVKQMNPCDGIDRSGPRWDPDRLSVDLKFVLGSKANKALGFGATRGRLYTKHPDLFRYIGDGEDKVWLSERGLMPPAGGRAYLLVKQDIEELLQSREYHGAAGVNPKDMGEGFVIPQFMINKMKELMSQMRSASLATKKSHDIKIKGEPHVVSNNNSEQSSLQDRTNASANDEASMDPPSPCSSIANNNSPESANTPDGAIDDNASSND